MDIPISQINTRLFSQLPPDPGLGLLFAVGTAGQIVFASGGKPIQFTLRHQGYALRCKVAPDVTPSFDLVDGQEVRATGHLSFSSQSARFHLLVRDLELLPKAAPLEQASAPRTLLETRERTVTPGWLKAVQRRARAAEPAQLVPGDLPSWVQELAPPEVSKSSSRRVGDQWGSHRAKTALETAISFAEIDTAQIAGPDRDDPHLPGLLEVLDQSEHEDIELTAEVLARLGGAKERVDGSLAENSQDRTPASPGQAARQKELFYPLPTHPAAAYADYSKASWYERPAWIVALLIIVGAIIILLSILNQFAGQ